MAEMSWEPERLLFRSETGIADIRSVASAVHAWASVIPVLARHTYIGPRKIRFVLYLVGFKRPNPKVNLALFFLSLGGRVKNGLVPQIRLRRISKQSLSARHRSGQGAMSGSKLT